MSYSGIDLKVFCWMKLLKYWSNEWPIRVKEKREGVAFAPWGRWMRAVLSTLSSLEARKSIGPDLCGSPSQTGLRFEDSALTGVTVLTNEKPYFLS
jgi:hypothetical protein